MPIEIRRVETLKQLRAFAEFPLRIYEGNPYWVPPLLMDEMNTLRKDKNPAFERCEAEYWIAYKDNKPVGRIAGIINRPYIEKWGNKYARFGWLDFVEDFEVCGALMRTVEDWARAEGMVAVNGPMGFTDMDKEGMLIEGFDELGTLPMLYNYPYYPQYLERLGYVKDVDWLEFEVKVPEAMPEKVLRVQSLIAKRTGIHLYEWKNTKELVTRFAKDIFAILEETYAPLYGTVPLTEHQVDAYIKQYLGFVDPRFTKVVVDAQDKLIGFGVSMPSLSRALQKSKGKILPLGWFYLLSALRTPKGIDMYLIAVRPEYKSRGIVSFIMTALYDSCIKVGVKTAETSGELETNTAVQQMWKEYEHRQHKRRRAYLKRIG